MPDQKGRLWLEKDRCGFISEFKNGTEFRNQGYKLWFIIGAGSAHFVTVCQISHAGNPMNV